MNQMREIIKLKDEWFGEGVGGSRGEKAKNVLNDECSM